MRSNIRGGAPTPPSKLAHATLTASKCSSFATMARALTCNTPASCSKYFNGCIGRRISPAPASASRSCSASSTATAGASGPMRRSIAVRHSTSQQRLQIMSDERADILLVEDNPNDVKLTLHAFKTANLANAVHVARDGVEALEFLFGVAPGRDE